MAERTRRTPKKDEDWEAFLAALDEHDGLVSHAADAIAIHRQRAYEHREQDEDFRRRWDEVVERSTERMESEAIRRAVGGVDKPIYYQGERVDTVREYSDTLLMFMIKGRKPEIYRDHHEVKHSGSVEHRHRLNLKKLTDVQLAALEAIQPDAGSADTD